MLVGDISITDLFDAIGDALTLPPAATPDGEATRSALLGHRIAAVCAAVEHVRTTGDPVEALDLLDAAVEAHPVAYTCRPHPRAGGAG
ncbi:hypothetical protein [Nocardiopsis lambiniae]|uniref:Tetratricopeptide repeat protein n=1 Tax=Nocardiopsis lambiniae TaxID=3075539 RepID=A0ABU2MFD6_9ACTN|nr:hypothetical protein [Nocardiopsis sp. DSM 44743]MDT0331342.1 hypothetical protein [Nocardiopsis sp. DSM 44743]